MKDFKDFLGENRSLRLSNDEIQDWIESNTTMKQAGHWFYTIEKDGKVIVVQDWLVINTDKSNCKQIPIIFSEKCNSNMTIKFSGAKQLTTLQGFPPLPNARFIIRKQNTDTVRNVGVNIPDDQFDLVFNDSDINNGRTLSPIGIIWLKSGLSWEEFKASHRGTIHGHKYNI